MSSAANSPTVVLIDGRSGAGKTEYATELARTMGATLVSLDDVYPGWHGLDAGSWHIWQRLIIPISQGQPGTYRRWDWPRSEPGDWATVDPGVPLVVEGCGTLRSDRAEVAAKKIWIDTPCDVRLERAMARDGVSYGQHWETWARQEERFLSLHGGPESADVVVTNI